MSTVLFLMLWPLPTHSTVIHPTPISARYHLCSLARSSTNFGRLALSCNREPTQLFVNGRYWGTVVAEQSLPTRFRLPPGRHLVRLAYSNKVFHQFITVQAGQELSLDIRF